jgi:hypothetical protein
VPATLTGSGATFLATANGVYDLQDWEGTPSAYGLPYWKHQTENLYLYWNNSVYLGVPTWIIGSPLDDVLLGAYYIQAVPSSSPTGAYIVNANPGLNDIVVA